MMQLRDLNNPKMVAEYSPEAEWKRTLLIDLAKRFWVKTLIETGTSDGGTVEACAPYFQEIYSIELSKVTFDRTQARLKYDNVQLIHGSSSQVLPSLLENIIDPKPMFWLDAHISGIDSADAGNQVPSELKTIARLKPGALVLIDDVKPMITSFFDGFTGPDGPLGIPAGWQTIFLHGVLVTFQDGLYEMPEVF